MSYRQVAQYDESGRITGIAIMPSKHPLGVGHLELTSEQGNVSDETHYAGLTTSPHTIREKVKLPLTHTIEGLEVSFPSLPKGTEILLEDVSVTADDAGVQLDFDIPGTYHLSFDPPPKYTMETLEVTVG